MYAHWRLSPDISAWQVGAGIWFFKWVQAICVVLDVVGVSGRWGTDCGNCKFLIEHGRQVGKSASSFFSASLCLMFF